MTNTLRPVALVGGMRIPFCRANTAYSALSNQDMLSTVLNGLIEKYSLEGEEMGEVVAGSVITHSRDWNFARETLLSTSLSPLTPGLTIQQACGTSLQAAMLSSAKIATGQIECAIAGGADTVSDVPIVFGRKFARRLVQMGKARSMMDRIKLFKGFSPRELKPLPPSVNEPRTLMSMGDHTELMAQEWGITREAQDQFALESHLKAAAAYDEGFFDDLITPCEQVMRDNNMRPDTSIEQLRKLRLAYEKSEHGTLTAGNSTPLTDGASSVLLASEEWARERGLPILAYLTHSQTAAVDFVAGEGLLMAPTVAVSKMLKRAGLTLQEFDFYEIHEAFAAQVLCTLAAWESEDYCKNRLGRDEVIGSIDRRKLNLKGSSLAVGHPFAATGARIVGTLGKIIDDNSGGRGLISVCTAGGMGVTAILER
ncbi:acetyl-CoA acetyltransferase [Chromatiales bacterium (ex Bugula neritina AB1)]|nr:acetyl-CoA acetyltransferase [Chromatiales bacterium (ex Bugula neritina AB1)]